MKHNVQRKVCRARTYDRCRVCGQRVSWPSRSKMPTRVAAWGLLHNADAHQPGDGISTMPTRLPAAEYIRAIPIGAAPWR